MSDATAPENDTTDGSAGIAPAEIAGGEVLDNEPGPGDTPVLTVRDRQFRLRTAIPGFTLSKVSRVGAKAQRVADHAAKLDDGRLDMAALSDGQRRAMSEAAASAYDLFKGLISSEDFDDFDDFMADADPPIEASEMSDLLAAAMEARSGRPTTPPSPSQS